LTCKRHERVSRDEEARFYDDRAQRESRKDSFLQTWLKNLAPYLPSAVDQILEALGDVRDRHICEIGCGSGILTLALLQKGALVTASDISLSEVKMAWKRNERYRKDRVSFHLMDAANLAFRDESFDFVVGISILHHVDLDQAAREIRRILKPGGHAIFTEPLAHNPLANLWRKMTPGLRSKNEWPLRYREIRRFASHFRSFHSREFACITLLSSLVYLVTLSKTCKDKAGARLARWEKTALKSLPFLRRFSGLVLLEFMK